MRLAVPTRAARLLVVPSLICATAACSLVTDDASATTCSQFAAMGPDTGLATSFTSGQQKVLSDLLSEQDRVPGQEMQAGLQVIAYCNIAGGHASSNADEPISNIPGLQD